MSDPKSGRGRLQEVVVYNTRGPNCKALTLKILVFWIGGRLWEVVAHGSSTVVNKNITSYFLNGTFCSFGVNVSIVNVKLNSS